jgi:hypothetical protein
VPVPGPTELAAAPETAHGRRPAGDGLSSALAPRAVAVAQHSATQCTEVSVSCAVTQHREPGDESVGDALQSGLEAAARSVSHLKPRPAPRVTRNLDGTHSYDGHVFRATIRPDGHVEFEDKAGGVSASLGLPFALSFDLTDTVEKHILGKEIYAAEKRWFLEQTRELRERLARQEQRRVLRRGLERIRGRLVAIIEDQSRSPHERKRAVFALWNDCSDDEVGERAKLAIEALIRERMPRDGALGYGDDELAAFDLQRAGRRPFAPYSV